MPSFLDERIKHKYTLNGTMKLEYREELRKKGWSEVEISQLEQMHIRDAEIARKRAKRQQELAQKRAEWNAQNEEGRRQHAEQLGLPYKPLPFSTGNSYNCQNRAEEMVGLDREELLSQGFLEPDDFYNPNDESISSSSSKSKVGKSEVYFDPNWEPEGGWVDF